MDLNKDKDIISEVKLQIEELLYANKRMAREYQNLIKTYNTIEIFYNYELSVISFVIYSNTENVLEYKITMSIDSYPFIPPKIYYKDNPYISFLKMPTQRFQSALKQLTNKECLCCDSFCCRDKWSPCFTITHIIEEINNIRKIKKNIILKVLIEQVKLTYLIDDIDICSYIF